MDRELNSRAAAKLPHGLNPETQSCSVTAMPPGASKLVCVYRSIYDNDLLKVIPEEILAKDYGCGDASRYIRVS